MPHKKIFIIGFMGAGKTSLGKILAKKLSIPVFDLDEIIEREEKKTIADLFSKMGEEEFRKLEGKYLKEFSYPEEFIMSTGGGTPCFYDHMDWMNSTGKTFYLQLNPKSLSARLIQAKDQKRPLLKEIQGQDLENYITQKLKEREPYYLLANYQLKGENVKLEDLIGLLL